MTRSFHIREDHYRGDQTSGSVLRNGGATLQDALQAVNVDWQSEYGRQYSRTVVTILEMCDTCYGEGKILKTTRRTQRYIRCPECKGKDSETPHIDGLVLQRQPEECVSF